jgi:hypothetical protein
MRAAVVVVVAFEYDLRPLGRFEQLSVHQFVMQPTV